MQLDVLDKKILNQLNQKPRASFSEIAKKARASKEIVNYRVSRLKKEGIIKEFVTIFGLGYWAYKVLIDFSQIDVEKEKKILEYLTNHPNANWVTSCSGGWDLVFAVMVKDPEHFDKVLRQIMGKLGKHVREYKVATSIGSQTFGHTYILGRVKEPEKIQRKKKEFDFDEKDKQIARILHKNARAHLMEISTQTGIPVDTVNYRIKKMEQNSIIKRYRMILNPSVLGYHRYEIFIRCINLTDPIISKFREYAKQNKHIEYFSRCVGSWDIELTVHFKTSDELRKFILEVKQNFGENIQKFETITLFETLNYVYFPEEFV